MHTSERHRHKRPFQPAITSYFAPYDDLDSDNDDDLRGLHPTTRPRTHHQSKVPQRESLAPQVPGHVQADLLQVGMRVRKSVPEGYKTHLSKMSALPSIQTTLAKPPTTTTIALDMHAPRDHVPDAHVHQRELLPFCGLHKIGGYAEQPTTNIHLYAGVDAATGQRPTNLFPLPAAAFSQPFSSQDSGYGSDILRSNSSKRSWRDDDERLDISGSNFFFAVPGMKAGVEVDEVPVSPMSETPEVLPRLVKQPKSRRPAASRGLSATSTIEDVDMEAEDAGQVAEGRISAGSGSDFEEADFLASGGEVSMSGI